MVFFDKLGNRNEIGDVQYDNFLSEQQVYIGG